MLDILILYFLCRSVGNILRKKNRSPLLFQIMMVLFYIGGVLGAAFVYGVYLAIVGVEFEMSISSYLIALLGGAIGAATVFLIAYLVPDARPDPSPSYAGFAQPGFGHAPQQSPLPPPTSQNPYNPFSDQGSPYDSNPR